MGRHREAGGRMTDAQVESVLRARNRMMIRAAELAIEQPDVSIDHCFMMAAFEDLLINGDPTSTCKPIGITGQSAIHPKR